MNTDEFISEWELKKNVKNNNRAVGIAINWRIIPQQSKVVQLFGEEAWSKIGDLYPPIWGNFKRTKLKEWLNPKRPDYKKFIDEEKNKIEFYGKNGLPKGYRKFCAFANLDGSVGVLGDGSHRYINCNYLISQGVNLNKDIKKCKLDLLCLPNPQEVISSVDCPPELKNSSKKTLILD